MGNSFTLFPNLPTELRLKIWRHALPLFLRILEAKHHPSSTTTQKSRILVWNIKPTAKMILLSINRESRNELMRFYATPFNPDTVFPSNISCLHFSYKIDTLFLDITDLCYLWPRIYTFTQLLESIFGASFPEAQRELRSLAGSEDFWDTIVLQKLESEGKVLENFVSLKENIVVFEQGILDGDDRLVRFEDVENSEWAGEERLYFEQFPRVEGVTVRACRGVGKKELGLVTLRNKWKFMISA
jgi:hypothetical protein